MQLFTGMVHIMVTVFIWLPPDSDGNCICIGECRNGSAGIH
jgi:hypothetical protein